MGAHEIRAVARPVDIEPPRDGTSCGTDGTAGATRTAYEAQHAHVRVDMRRRPDPFAGQPIPSPPQHRPHLLKEPAVFAILVPIPVAIVLVVVGVIAAIVNKTQNRGTGFRK